MLNREDAEARLRASGLRLTPQRRAVIEALVDNRTHPSTDEVAAEVIARVPGVSLSTVYKTLHELAELGLLLQLDTPGAMRFDPETAEHAHMICDNCGEVTDISIPADTMLRIRTAARNVGTEPGAVEIMLRGVCADCTIKH